MKRLFPAAAALLLALPVQSQENQIAHPTARSHWVQEDIYHYAPQDEIKPLLAGEDEFLALYRPHMAATQRGAIVIIPDWQKTPAGHGALDHLRKSFNDLGYATLAITIPDRVQKMPEEKADSSEQSQPQAAPRTQAVNAVAPIEPRVSDKQLDDYKLALMQRFNSVYQLASEEPGQISVIAEGASAALLLEYLATLPELRLDAFISISAYLPNTVRNQHIAANMSVVAPALLDLYFSLDSPAVSHSKDQRLRWARKNHKYDFRQRQLFGQTDANEQHQRMEKEIYGFLRRL